MLDDRQGLHASEILNKNWTSRYSCPKTCKCLCRGIDIHPSSGQAILIEKLVTTDFAQLALGTKDPKFADGNISTKLENEVSTQMTHLAANALKMGKLTQLIASFGTSVHKFVKQFIKNILERHLDGVWKGKVISFLSQPLLQ